jgi:hypothetical protein
LEIGMDAQKSPSLSSEILWSFLFSLLAFISSCATACDRVHCGLPDLDHTRIPFEIWSNFCTSQCATSREASLPNSALPTNPWTPYSAAWRQCFPFWAAVSWLTRRQCARDSRPMSLGAKPPLPRRRNKLFASSSSSVEGTAVHAISRRKPFCPAAFLILWHLVFSAFAVVGRIMQTCLSLEPITSSYSQHSSSLASYPIASNVSSRSVLVKILSNHIEPCCSLSHAVPL